MSREWVVLGLSMPTFVPLFFICVAAMWVLDTRVFTRWRLYRYVAHPPLFRISLFVLLFCFAGLCIY